MTSLALILMASIMMTIITILPIMMGDHSNADEPSAYRKNFFCDLGDVPSDQGNPGDASGDHEDTGDLK